MMVVKILRIRIEKKIKDVLGENQFGFKCRRRKRTRDAIEVLKVISERTLNIDKVWYACVIKW
jgi:predicted transcriptional regulator